MDFIVQKAVELGVSAIIPIITTRVIVRFDENKKQKRQQHWQKIAISAAEQCGRSVITQIKPVITFSEYIQNNTTTGFVLNHRSDKTMQDYQKISEVNLLIGSEGGLSEHEIDLALDNNHRSLLLTKTVLRAETTSIAALSQLSLLWG